MKTARLVPLVAGLLVSTSLFGQLARESFLVATPRIGGAPYFRGNPRVTASDEQFLVVWDDDREAHWRPWAMRLSRTGAVLDPLGFPLDTARDAHVSSALSVASDGTDFLVAARRGEVMTLIKVTRDGIVQNVPDFELPAMSAKLVWIGHAYALFLKQSDTLIQAVILDSNGRVITPAHDVLESTGTLRAFTASIAPGGTQVLIAWLDGNDKRVHVAPTNAATLHAGQTRINATSAMEEAPLVYVGLSSASSGSGHFVGWMEGRTNEYRGRLVDENGAPAGDIITFASGATGNIDVTWNGSRYVVACTVLRGFDHILMVAEVDRNGVLVKKSERPATTSHDVAVASAGASTLLVWESDADSGPEHEQILADVIDTTFTFVHPEGILVSASRMHRSGIEAVRLGDHYLAAWTEGSVFAPGTAIMVLARFDAEGRQLDGAGIHPSEDVITSPPALASDGHDALVVWGEGSGPYGASLRCAHVEANGRIRQRTIVSLLSYTPFADVVWNGEDYVVYTSGYLFRLAPNGTLREKVVVPATGLANAGRLVWTGSHYVVVWIETHCFPVCFQSLWAVAVGKDFVATGPALRLAHLDVSALRPVAAAAVAGDQVLVVYAVQNGNALRGVRMSASGTVLDVENGFAIGTSASRTSIGKYVKSVFANGENWVVMSGPYTWEVTRSGQVSERQTPHPFVPEGSESLMVFGGPAPLVVYQDESVPQVYARFMFPPRRRAVR